MLQIFIQPSKITSTTWQTAYQNIKSIVENFPTKLVRLESYRKYEKKLDKLHLDVVVDENTPNEHISIWGDWMSFTGKTSVRFYKDWEKQKELQIWGEEVDVHKSIVYFTEIPYKNDGDLPRANGVNLYPHHVIHVGGACYQSALIAIGMMFEKLFPNAAFLTLLWGEDAEQVEAVKNWMEWHFGEPFSMPLYFDKLRLLKLLKKDYENEKEVVCRLAHLYREKHKHNMDFALENIGYEPTFQLYTEVLASTGFGTFGFADILDPWIAATQDLEATLNLVTASKNFLLQQADERSQKKAQQYDLVYVLKTLLNSHILLPPVKREMFRLFHTNEQAVEGKSEDLFGAMRRMMGYRIDICPIYASEKELFEAFMYHDPKNGKVFKKIIEDWVAESTDKYDRLQQELDVIIDDLGQDVGVEKIEEAEVKVQRLRQDFLEKYAYAEKYFAEKVIDKNPYYLDVGFVVKAFKKRVVNTIKEHSDQAYIEDVKNLPKEKHIGFIKYRMHELEYLVHPDFEKWLDNIDDSRILFHLHIACALQLYDKNSHYSRFRLLWDSDNWNNWNETV